MQRRNWGAYQPRKKVPLTCAGCGQRFESTRPDAKTCSPRCRKAVSRWAKESEERAARRAELRKLMPSADPAAEQNDGQARTAPAPSEDSAQGAADVGDRRQSN